MRMITKTSELEKACLEFAEAPYITVDTEFLRERTYWSQLCLVQIAKPGDEDGVLIDPLAVDIRALRRLFESDVEAVFHAAQQDLDVLTHSVGSVPRRMFR